MNKVLEIGCGPVYYKPKEDEEVVYTDLLPFKHVDVTFDLNEFPYPFEDNTFDKVVARHILEHVKHIFKTIEELHRISRNGAEWYIVTPFFSASIMHANFDHRIGFGYGSFNSHDPQKRVSKYDSKMYKFPELKIRRIYLRFGTRGNPTEKLNWLINPIVNLAPRFYQRFFCWILPVEEIRYWLEVVKIPEEQLEKSSKDIKEGNIRNAEEFLNEL